MMTLTLLSEKWLKRCENSQKEQILKIFEAFFNFLPLFVKNVGVSLEVLQSIFRAQFVAKISQKVQGFQIRAYFLN